jgi:hypothetical protein
MINEYSYHSLTPEINAPAPKTETHFDPLWIRLAARLFASSLDLKLAAGQHPAASYLLAIRAQQLVASHSRQGIADSWLDILIKVRRPRTPFDSTVPLVRKSIMDAEGQIRTLAAALVSPLPTVRGVAMAIAMLRDGAGPLFNRNSEVTLTDAVEDIIARMNPITLVSTL